MVFGESCRDVLLLLGSAAAYDYKNHDWTDLGHCNETSGQSPIVLPASLLDSLAASGETLAEYKMVPVQETLELTLEYHQYAIRVRRTSESDSYGTSLALDGADFHMREFHFHAHSEHVRSETDSNSTAAEPAVAEMHIVFGQSTTYKAVVGYLLYEDSAVSGPPILSTLLDVAPTNSTDGDYDFSLDVPSGGFLALVDEGLTTNFVHYNGSLTAPDCNAPILWFLRETKISSPQATWITSKLQGENSYGGNYRNTHASDGMNITAAHILLDTVATDASSTALGNSCLLNILRTASPVLSLIAFL